jgi:hypothetical protein
MATRGGVFHYGIQVGWFVGQDIQWQFTFENLTLVHNSALQGGGLYALNNIILPFKNCYFYENHALLYGNTFAGSGVFFEWTKRMNKTSYQSGDTMDQFAVTMEDRFRQAVIPIAIYGDFLYVDVKLLNDTEPNQKMVNEAIWNEIEKPLLSGSDEIPFSKVQVVAPPGKYTLVVAPAINYDRAIFNLKQPLSIEVCTSPKVLKKISSEKYSRCMMRKLPNHSQQTTCRT